MRVTYFWTKQEDTYLKVFFYKLDKVEISKQLHIINPKAKRTACSITNRAYKLNLHLIPKVDINKQRESVFELIKKGYTIPEINKKTNISIANINKFFEHNYLSNQIPEEIERRYYNTEEDILKEINLSYDSENLKGWELEQFKKL
tara:strand:- start:583 stop:1020 length:438 start_codon:yes stop_codon:yes gene_type:complete